MESLTSSSDPNNFLQDPLLLLDFGPFTTTLIIDWLTIDSLVKDFWLEAMQKANFHAFVRVSTPLFSSSPGH